MHTKAVLSAALAICLVVPATAHADVIFANAAFSTSTVSMIDVTPFDPSLGTLDSVDVTINGVLIVSGFAPMNGTFAPTGEFIPVPYNYRVDVTQDFDGLGSSFFDFSTPATVMLPGFSPGVASPFTLVTPFTYTFEFNAFTDIIGFDFPSVSSGVIPPLTGVIGTRSGFLDSGAPLNLVLMTQLATGVPLEGVLPLVTSAESAGSILLQYNYTPRAVPEPAAAVLIALGLTRGRVSVLRYRFSVRR
jgi:hypothetical protein